MSYAKAAPGLYKAMLGLETYLGECGLEANLLDLVRVRASQINGCAFCLDMHTKDLRARGESEQPIYLLEDSWNRLNVSFRTVVGKYQPAQQSAR